MFDLLKKAFGTFTKKTTSESKKEETIGEKITAKAEEIKKVTKEAEKILSTAALVEKKAEVPLKELKKVEERVSFIERFAKVLTETKITSEHFDKVFSVLETELLQNNVSIGVAEKIKEKLKTDLVETSIKRGQVSEIIRDDLKDVIFSVLTAPQKINFLEMVGKIKNEGRPAILLFVGANGHGKTTTIAKVANFLKQNKISCVFAASDTFRAASIEQLEAHGIKLEIRVIKQQYGADPAAVAFDAVKHATANKIDCVLVDSAGRQHTNANLMDELKKLKRVAKPDLTIFVGESIAGHDVVDQISDYNKAVGIDAIILTKADVDDKGGAVISAVHSINKPILFLGVGQEYKDLMEFNADEFIKKII